MNQQDKSFLTTFTTVMAVLVMLAVAIFMISRLVAVLAAKPDDGSRRLAAVAERIQKVGEVTKAGSPASSSGGTATASPATQQVAAAAPSGEAIYTQACAACHAAGVLQAPKLGSKEQWEPRFAQGLDTLVHNAVNGIRAMPAKGGYPNLSDEDIRHSIVYMLQESGIEVAEATTQVAEAPAASDVAPDAVQQTAPAAETPVTQQPAAAAPALAPVAPTTGKPQSAQEVTMAAAEAANAASQAAAAASQAAAAASQAAAAASQAAAAVAQAIDMLREMASMPATPQAAPALSAPALSAPAEKAKPAAEPSAPAPSAPTTQPAAKAAKPVAAAPAAEKAPLIPRTLSGPAAGAPNKSTPKSTPAKKTAPLVEEKPVAPAQETTPATPPVEPAAAAQEPVAATQEHAATAASPAAAPAAVDITIPSDIHLARGKQLYSTACVICHQAGVAGAPKLGDKAEWAPRLTQGFDTLVEHSINGYKGMPPKGGRLDIPNREIRSAVGYMLSELE